jgi:hypothetical protein
MYVISNSRLHTTDAKPLNKDVGRIF